MARFLGIDAPVNMIFFLGFCLSSVIIYILTVTTFPHVYEDAAAHPDHCPANEDRIKALEQRLDLQAGDERETVHLQNEKNAKHLTGNKGICKT